MGFIKTLARFFCGHQPLINELNSLIEEYKKASAKLKAELLNLKQPEWGQTNKPAGTKQITVDELRTLLKQRWNCPIHLSDSVYLLPAFNDIADFLAQDSTNRMDFAKDAFDCDDFAYRLLGQFSVPNWSQLAFGMVWTEKHALNCVLDEDLNFWFVEPQNDDIQSQLKDWQGQKLQFILI